MKKTIKLDGKALPYLIEKIIKEMNYSQPSRIQINDKIKSEIIEIKTALDAFEQATTGGYFDDLFFQMENISVSSKNILNELKTIRENAYFNNGEE